MKKMECRRCWQKAYVTTNSIIIGVAGSNTSPPGIVIAVVVAVEVSAV